MIVYLSGPMSGHEQLNFPAFHAAAEKLRANGYHVISPAEIPQPVQTWEACMREDLKEMMRAHIVAVLPGWEQSKGARIEVKLARELGMKIVDASTFEEITLEQSA